MIEIDIDDHGLLALWDAQAPNLKRMISEGVLAYTHVDVPTHSNHNNMTLITGEWPEADNVPSNSWLDRGHNYQQPFSLAGQGLGSYVFYNQNPINNTAAGPAHHVESTWTTAHEGGFNHNIYVGQLPPWDVGADEVHYTVNDSKVFGLPLNSTLIDALLTSEFLYPASLVNDGGITYLDGPPNPAPDGGPADAGETIEHYTIRDAANIWANAANGGTPPPYMFVWAFIALDGDPTSAHGADTDELQAVVDDYDNAIGDLLNAIDNSPYAGRVNIVFTLDHGKVDTSYQALLGYSGNDGQQLAQLVAAQGAPEVGLTDYDLLNEDGDALIYAKVPDAGSASGFARQQQVVHKLVDLVQAGTLPGVDVTRTITWDGYRGTRTMHDNRIEGPNQADFIVFPQTGVTLGQVSDGGPGAIDTTQHPEPFGRHGGYSEDELYVPLIMWGPSFKHGVTLPHPVHHADVAPTVMKILGQEITSAEGAPILDAFVGDNAEVITDPADMTTTRPTVLTLTGFHGTAALLGTPATQAVVVDLGGVSYDEAFVDPITSAHLPTLAALAYGGVNFEFAWNRYRTIAENRFELLAGGTPTLDPSSNWLATAESDPAQDGFPGRGLLLEPAPAGVVPNPAALTAWRSNTPWASDSLVQAAEAAGFPAVLVGDTADPSAHFSLNANDLQPTTDAQASTALATFLSAHSQALGIVTLGQGGRTADRHSAAALAELDALDTALQGVVQAAGNALLVVTSTNGADIDDPAATFYGAQDARHVPLVISGAPARAGVITGQPATAADIPATVLFALGRTGSTDFAEGTWIAGTPNADGVPQPIPATATAGHVLASAFDLHP